LADGGVFGSQSDLQRGDDAGFRTGSRRGGRSIGDHAQRLVRLDQSQQFGAAVDAVAAHLGAAGHGADGDGDLLADTISSSDGSQPTSTSTLASATAPTAVLPAPTDSVAFVGNPKCGMSHDPSDETGFAAPIGTYLCAEKNYLHKLELDNIDVPDPIAIIKAAYDHVCALVGPSDLDTPNLGAREDAAKKELLNSGVVLSADDAQAVVSDAVTELC